MRCERQETSQQTRSLLRETSIMNEKIRSALFRSTTLRRIFQFGILGGVIALALGYGNRSFEAFCPFGGVEAAWALFREKAYTCTLSEMNLAMLIGVAGLTLLAGKTFCSWICPIGLINEMLYKLGRNIPGLARVSLPIRADRWLRLLRYPFTALMVVLTWRAGELILRGYDPFFLIFSGFGHGALGIVSYISLAALLAGALVIPMFWCRLLCPLGAAMDLLGRFGLIRVHRREGDCTACGACDEVCLQRLRVSDQPSVASIDCTRCLDCVESCPTGALSLSPGLPNPAASRRPLGRLTALALPVPVAAALLVGVRLAGPLTLPTATATLADAGTLQRPLAATMTVEGVKCRGTANLFINRLKTFPGIGDVAAFAGTHRVKITFDGARITPQALKDSIDAPVPHPKTGERYPGIFTCTSMKVED